MHKEKNEQKESGADTQEKRDMPGRAERIQKNEKAAVYRNECMWDIFEAWFYQITAIAKRRRRVLLSLHNERDCLHKSEQYKAEKKEGNFEQLSLFMQENTDSKQYATCPECTLEEIYYLGQKQLEVYITKLYRKEKIDEKYAKEDALLIANEKKAISPRALYEEYQRKRIAFISQSSSFYPASLHQISDKPMALYQIREKEMSEKVPVVAIIGARECSEYGMYVAKELGRLCAGLGIHVVSGLAYGIDGIAQMATRNAGGMVTAVLGSGVDVCYPAQNRRLYNDLAKNGRILSEYIPGTQPKPHFFPPRNRIISGLADAVIVVEAKKKSGTLITVDMALEQGKDVYVVPGRLTDAMSYGCNRLIAQGAEILYDPRAVLDEIRQKAILKRGTHKNPCNSKQAALTCKGKKEETTGPIEEDFLPAKGSLHSMQYDRNSLEGLIYRKTSVQPMGVDALYEAVSKERDVTYQQMLSVLFEMEMKDMIKEKAGRYGWKL